MSEHDDVTDADRAAADSALCDITDDDCNLRGWPVQTLADHFAAYRKATQATAAIDLGIAKQMTSDWCEEHGIVEAQRDAALEDRVEAHRLLAFARAYRLIAEEQRDAICRAVDAAIAEAPSLENDCFWRPVIAARRAVR